MGHRMTLCAEGVFPSKDKCGLSKIIRYQVYNITTIELIDCKALQLERPLIYEKRIRMIQIGETIIKTYIGCRSWGNTM